MFQNDTSDASDSSGLANTERTCTCEKLVSDNVLWIHGTPYGADDVEVLCIIISYRRPPCGLSRVGRNLGDDGSGPVHQADFRADLFQANALRQQAHSLLASFDSAWFFSNPRMTSAENRC